MATSDNTLDGDQRKSRSQVKREFEEIAQFATQLCQLSDGELKQLSLSDSARIAIADYQAIRKGPAKKRQHKFLSKLLHDEDLALVREECAALHSNRRSHVNAFHAVENWRDKIISDGDEALMAFCGEQPDCDRQTLRQLMLQARKEHQQNQQIDSNASPKKKYYRALFQALKQQSDKQ